jgi:proteasome lid subunit RPN8/RPN11
MNTRTLKAIRAHAESSYPRESCGLMIVVKGKSNIFPARIQRLGQSISSFRRMTSLMQKTKARSWRWCIPILTRLLTRARRIRFPEASGLPWHIVSVHLENGVPVAKELKTFNPAGYEAPLIGREFFHGVLDCYTLIRDWYRIEKAFICRIFGDPMTGGMMVLVICTQKAFRKPDSSACRLVLSRSVVT